MPVDHLYACRAVGLHSKKKVGTCDRSPDAGGGERARAFAKRLQANLAIIDKRREGQTKRTSEPHRRTRRQKRAAAGRYDRHGRTTCRALRPVPTRRARSVDGLHPRRAVGAGVGTPSTVEYQTGDRDIRFLCGGRTACPKLHQLSVAPLLVKRPAHPRRRVVSSLFA